MSLHRLLGFTTAVPDPEALAAFYGEMGLTGDPSSGFSGSDGGSAVRIEEGDVRRLTRIELGCHTEEDLATMASRLEAGGRTARLGGGQLSTTDPVSQVQLVVRVAEPQPTQPPVNPRVPNAPGATVRENHRAPAVADHARAPRRLGHLVLGTPDVKATRDLLVEGLGFKVSDEIDGLIAFLRCSVDHHNVALVGTPVPLLQHYSWECDDVDHVGHNATKLLRVDASRQTWGLGRHFAGSNFYWYLRDPAGSFIELYADMDQITDDEAWEAEGRTPFNLEHVANSWGPDIPLEFIVPTDLEQLQEAWAR